MSGLYKQESTAPTEGCTSRLGEQRVQYKDIMIDKLEEGKALRSELGKQYGQTSVPAIWVNGVFVGGCNDGGIGGLIPNIKSGKFQELLKK